MTAGEFEDFVKDKKFKNPLTGNEVRFRSLPAEEQAKIRSTFKNKSKKEEPSKGDTKEQVENLREKLESDPKFRAEFVDHAVEAISGEEVKEQMAESVTGEVKKKDLDNFTESLERGDAEGFKESMPLISRGVMEGVLKTLGVIFGAVALSSLSSDALVDPVIETMEDIKEQRLEELQEKHEVMKDDYFSEQEEFDLSQDQLEMFKEIDPQAQLHDELHKLLKTIEIEEVDSLEKGISSSKDSINEITRNIKTYYEDASELGEEIDSNKDKIDSLDRKIERLTSDKDYKSETKKDYAEYKSELEKMDKEIEEDNKRKEVLIQKMFKMNPYGENKGFDSKELSSLLEDLEEKQKERDSFVEKNSFKEKEYLNDLKRDDELELLELNQKKNELIKENEKLESKKNDLDSSLKENLEKKKELEKSVSQQKENLETRKEAPKNKSFEEVSKSFQQQMSESLKENVSNPDSVRNKKARMSKFSKQDKMNINMIVGLVQEKLKKKIKDLKKNPPKKSKK
jgi:hypothetical protein